MIASYQKIQGVKTVIELKPYQTLVVTSGSTKTTYTRYSDGKRTIAPPGDPKKDDEQEEIIFRETVETTADGVQTTYEKGSGKWSEKLIEGKIEWVPICHPLAGEGYLSAFI